MNRLKHLTLQELQDESRAIAVKYNQELDENEVQLYSKVAFINQAKNQMANSNNLNPN
jgi:hypothetical protein